MKPPKNPTIPEQAQEPKFLIQSTMVGSGTPTLNPLTYPQYFNNIHSKHETKAPLKLSQNLCCLKHVEALCIQRKQDEHLRWVLTGHDEQLLRRAVGLAAHPKTNAVDLQPPPPLPSCQSGTKLHFASSFHFLRGTTRSLKRRLYPGAYHIKAERRGSFSIVYVVYIVYIVLVRRRNSSSTPKLFRSVVKCAIWCACVDGCLYVSGGGVRLLRRWIQAYVQYS